MKGLGGNLEAHTGPLFGANAVSKMSFTPVIPIVWNGSSEKIEHEHLWRLRKLDATITSWERFEPYWKREQHRRAYALCHLRAALFFAIFPIPLTSVTL